MKKLKGEKKSDIMLRLILLLFVILLTGCSYQPHNFIGSDKINIETMEKKCCEGKHCTDVVYLPSEDKCYLTQCFRPFIVCVYNASNGV